MPIGLEHDLIPPPKIEKTRDAIPKEALEIYDDNFQHMIPTGIGYNDNYGYFVLVSMGQGPVLAWIQYLKKEIVYLGEHVLLACDGKCNKAWGVNNRPRNLSDLELDDAPSDPGTYEGSDAKPQNSSEVLNKWCARECERSHFFGIGKPIKLTNFTKRVQYLGSHRAES